MGCTLRGELANGETALSAENGYGQFTGSLDQYLDGLYGYALVLSRNRAVAEDLVQETCLRAIRSEPKLRPDSNVKSWLFTILRNLWLNELREVRSAPPLVDLGVDGSDAYGVADPSNDPHAFYVSKIERERVRAAIEQLPLEFREIIILREYEELSYQEIGAVLSVPPGTVMSRLARARGRLRDLLIGREAHQQKQTTDGKGTGTAA